jgi:hypothetical protein
MDKEEFQRALEKYPKVRDKEYKVGLSPTILAAAHSVNFCIV